MHTSRTGPPLSGKRLFARAEARAALVLAGALSVACGVGGGRTSRSTVERELLVPYVDTLNAGDVDGAWRTYTSDGYRGAHSLIRFEAGQARNRDEYGARLQASLLPDEPIPLAEPGHPPMWRFTARWEGERASGTVVLDLVDGPPWRIERTWMWPDDGLGSERVY